MSVVAAMQPRLDQERTMPQRPANSQDGAPDPSFLESLTASFRSARDDIPNAFQEQQDNAYSELVTQLVERGQDANKYVNTGRGGEGVRSLQVWADIEAERKKDPRAFPGLPRTKAEFDAQWQAKMRTRMERDAGTVARSGWVPWLLGSFGAGVTDPINVGAMLLTGGGSTIAGAALREGAINLGIEATELPLINAQRTAQGRPQMSAGEMATSLAVAGAIGAGFGAATKGIEVGGKAAYDKFVPLDVRAARALDEAVPRFSRTPDLNAAINVARADAEVRFGSPYVPTYEGIDAHFARLNDTLAKLQNGVKIEVVAPAVRPIAGDASAAIDSYMAAARAQESGGNDAARSKTSSAGGRYGFLDGTFVTYYRKAFPNTGLTDDRILARKNHGDVQERVMRAFTEDNAAWLQRNGIEANPGNLYVVHHMGPGGAGKIFRASADTPLAQLLTPEVMAANPHLEGMTAGSFRRWAAEKMGSDAGAIAPVADAPPMRPAALDAERPLIEGPDPIDVADIAPPEPPLRPEVVNDGLLTAMRAIVDDRKLSINDMPALARELGTDEDSLQPILQKLVDEGRLTLTKSGIYRRKMAQGPEDALTFIARRGGISWDGLDPKLADKIDSKGHDLRNSGNLNYFVPKAGPLLRRDGQGLDNMAELLWDAGYFGPPESTPRPTDTELIAWLDDAIRKKEKRYSFADQAPEAKTTAADFAPPKEDAPEVAADVAAQDRFWQRYDRWNEAADVAGTAPMLSGEIVRLEQLLAEGTDTLPPWREAELPSAEELAPYVLEMVNRDIDDVLEAAYLEIEDPYYDLASKAGTPAESGTGSAPDAGTARAGAADAGSGTADARPTPKDLDEIEAAGLGSPLIDEQAHAAFDDPAGEGIQQVADSAWHDVRAQVDAEAVAVRPDDGGIAGSGSDPIAPRDGGIVAAPSEAANAAQTGPGTDIANSNPLDNGAAVDPNLAARRRQELQLRAETPLGAGVKGGQATGVAQSDVMPEGLFGGQEVPTFDLGDATFDLGDGKGARTLKEIENEIAADEAAIDAIKGCLL